MRYFYLEVVELNEQGLVRVEEIEFHLPTTAAD
jgi:hypothetical protein